MKQPKKDFVAEAIADYEAMSQEEQGQMLVQILEDQPILMGFITNLADDFSETAHSAIVDSAVILINAFIAAGIPVQMIPHQLVEEVIDEKVKSYEEKEQQNALDLETMMELSDSPLVFQDLKNRAFFKSNLKEQDRVTLQNFNIVLDTIISLIERAAATEIDGK